MRTFKIGRKGQGFGLLAYVSIAIAIVILANLVPTIWNAVSGADLCSLRNVSNSSQCLGTWSNSTPYSTPMSALLPLTGLIVAVIILLIPVYKGLKG